MGGTYALIAGLHVSGAYISGCRVTFGRRLVVGEGGDLDVPLPNGVSWLVHGEWRDHRTVVLHDVLGRETVLTPDQRIRVTLDDVVVSLNLVQQVTFGRARPWTLATNLTVMVGMMLVMSSLQQTAFLLNRRCDAGAALAAMTRIPAAYRGPIAGTLLQGCEQDEAAGQEVMAEYIARLLKRDLAGEEVGEQRYEEDNLDDDALVRDDGIWLPAGNEGPMEAMGGARDVDKTPVRTPEPSVAAAAREEPLEAEDTVEDVAIEPIVDAKEPTEAPVRTEQAEAGGSEGSSARDEGFDDAVADASADDNAEAPAEEREGWGFKDWIDVRVLQRDRAVAQSVQRDAAARVQIDPNDVVALGLLAYTQYLANDYEAAETTFDKVIELDPNDAAGYNNKALVYKRRGEYDIEEGLYRVALALKPDDFTAVNNLAVNLAHQGRFAEALAYMKQLESVDPDDPYADLHRSKIHAAMGNDDQALFYLERAAKGVWELDTFHHIEFRQDIRLDPAFGKLRETSRFRDIIRRFFREDTPE